MRYADGPTVSVDINIEAPPSAVWGLISDIDLPARFSNEFLGARWLDGAEGPGVGARFEGRNRHPAAGEWSTVSTVLTCEPDVSFAWAVGDPSHATATWRFALAPGSDAASSTLSFSARLGPGSSGLTPAIEAMPDKEEKIVANRLREHRANMEATLSGIKQLAEHG